MSIGQTGKQAQQIGQRQRRRYQLGYGAADPTPLQRREVGGRQEDVQPSSTTSDAPVVQRRDEENAPVEMTQSITQGLGEQKEDAEIDVKAVADRVYAMLLEDSRRQRERWHGGR